MLSKYLIIKNTSDGFFSEVYETVEMALHSCNDGLEVLLVFNLETNCFVQLDNPANLDIPGIEQELQNQMILFDVAKNGSGYKLDEMNEFARNLFRNATYK